MATSSATVFVVDDDPALCQGLARVLESAGFVAQFFSTAADFLAGFDPQQAGCIVMDVRLPDMNGLELQKILNTRKVRTPIIMVSGFADVPMAVQAVQAGAIDFIPKPLDLEKFVGQVKAAVARDASLRGDAAHDQVIANRLATLSRREQDVLERLVAGRSAKQVAAELGISSKTIDNHRAKILQKMEVETTVELVHMILSRPQPR
ncbi:MAG: response regulator transcription factor [Planctomycetes bacterium]|nr:response regulator transcription factor [Planctomycetota bacterium]